MEIRIHAVRDRTALLNQDGIMVEIIEQDYDRCLSLANQLPDVTIVHGDASNEFLNCFRGSSQCLVLLSTKNSIASA